MQHFFFLFLFLPASQMDQRFVIPNVKHLYQAPETLAGHELSHQPDFLT